MRRTVLVIVFGLLTIGLFAWAATAATDPGVKTGKRPYLVKIDPGVVVDPIWSTGDSIGGYQMSGIPDGLGAYNDSGKVKLFMNHELGRTFPMLPPLVDTRISQLTLNDKTHGVLSAKYVFNGTEGFERFCSATLEEINGTPYYFAGEEAVNGIPPAPPAGHDGSSIVMNAETGQWWETPHFGHVQHENIVPVERIKKFMLVTTDDDFRANSPSLLLAYIADSFEDAVSGDPSRGSLYVWRALNATDTPASIHEGDTIPGKFVSLTQTENASSVTIKAAALAAPPAKDGFPFRFSRLEDAAVAQQTPGRVYFADTGKANETTVTGRIYRLDIDPSDPTNASLTFELDSTTHGFANPDNLDTSTQSLVFQEDREGPFRGIHNRVLVYDLTDKSLRVVARVDPPPGFPPGQWESSGVINAQTLLGNDWWLMDVQAHPFAGAGLVLQPGPASGPVPAQPPPNTAMGEDGQLLAVYIPNS